MATLTCVICAFLATQGFAATVRSEYQMKVDAHGKVEKFNANTDTDTAAETAQMVLAEMEDWARSGARPEEPKIKTIEGLAKELDKALKDTHAAAEDQVQKNIAEIEKCNADQASAIKTISETTKVEVGKQRISHATCRDAEVVIFKDMKAKCKHLTTWLKQTSDDSPTKPEGAADDEMVDYVEKMSGYWCKKGETAQEKEKVCEKRKEDHLAEKEKCDALQAQFENGFCSWRTKLIDVCEEQKTCYDAAKAAYKVHVSATEKLVVKWKTEYTALKKILCYVKVWLSDDKPETVDAGELKRCQQLSPDDSQMDVDFGKAPEKTKCSLEDVANYPGTDAFKEIEYKKWVEFVNEPSACLEEPEPTVGPLKPEPTVGPLKPKPKPVTEAPY